MLASRLMMNPTPGVNQAYSMILSDESQKVVVVNAGVLRTSPAHTSSLTGQHKIYTEELFLR